MELENLKSSWQNAGGVLKTDAEIQKMTRLAHLPSLKKIRTKLIAEIIGLGLFLLVYYDWFDGDQKSLRVNILLVSGVLLYILNNVVSYIAILTPIRGKQNLKSGIQNYLIRINRFSILSLILSIFYNITLLVFFSSVIHFTNEKKWMLAGIIAAFIIMIFLSVKMWARWIKNLQQQVNDFEAE